MFASGKNAASEREQRDRRAATRSRARRYRGEPERPAGGVERQRRGDPAGGDARRARRGARGPVRPRESDSAARPAPALPPLLRRRLGRFAARRRGARRVGRRCGFATSAPFTASRTWRGRSGRSVSSGGRALLDAARRLDQVAAPERMLAGERLPEDDAEAPDVGGRGGGQSRAAAPARCTRASRGCRRARSACRTRPSARARSRGAARRSRLTRRAARSTASRRGGRSRGGARARAHRRSGRRPRARRGRRALRRGAPRASCGPGTYS